MRGLGANRTWWLAAVAAVAALAASAGMVVTAARRARLEPMLVQGESMRPTLVPGQRIAVAPLDGAPPRGAVVVVRRPGPDGLEVVKRVVGLPGERVRLVGERLEVDGREAGEPWLGRGGAGLPRGGEVELDVALGPDEYLVLGDHRAASTDGRSFGPVGRSQLVGEVRFAYWPPRRLRVRTG